VIEIPEHVVERSVFEHQDNEVFDLIHEVPLRTASATIDLEATACLHLGVPHVVAPIDWTRPALPIVLDSDATYTHNRWMSTDAAVIETFDHKYKTVPDGPFASAQGHCIAGSTSDPYAPQYAIPCQLPNSFVWGEQVMQFFIAHPMP
jgi:hypothetical protein